MRNAYRLGDLSWTLSGWTPHSWRQQRSIEAGAANNADVPAVPARVPGSVQGALREAGVLPDWEIGLNSRLCEWVENRHWIYTCRIPEEWLRSAGQVRLRALGLDYCGSVLVNGDSVGSFTGSFVPHSFDLTPFIREGQITLQLVFECPPRWLGQIGYTSRMTEWKPRFNYGWDWISRLVQIGIWDDLWMETGDGEEISDLQCTAFAAVEHGEGSLQIRGAVTGTQGSMVRIELEGDDGPVRREEVSCERFAKGISWGGLAIDFWWPNGSGPQPLYTVRCTLLDAGSAPLDSRKLRVGFKSLTWARCEAAPRGADPWLCMVNGKAMFLQGVNWTPIRPNFADVEGADYRARLVAYRDLGCNVLRVWGGAYLEKEVFYDLCDELGLLVWQEFPLSSSGLEDWPPDDPQAIEDLAAIAESYVTRRRNHVSVAVWCGGNELQGRRPVDGTHPMIARLGKVVERHDPGRRFLPTSPSGPRFSGDEKEFGEGVHWDVHGPWNARGGLEEEWAEYWRNDDALFRSEVGAPGASPVDVIRRYKGDLPDYPGTAANPLWRRTSWWIEWPVFAREHGREPASLKEYVVWSQQRQARALGIAAAACKDRFPRCGGFIVWMGHDSFPCTANTAILDFHGHYKPAAAAIRAVFRGEK